MIHWLAHKFQWNLGVVESFYLAGVLFVGFRCGGCNKLQDIYEASK